MGIIMKFTLKSIFEKKFRTFLILLSITLSVALSLSSFALRDVTKNAIVEMVKKYFGTANVMVSAEGKSESQFVRLKDLGEHAQYFDYQIGSVQADGAYTPPNKHTQVKVTLRGYEEEDFKKLGNIKLKETLSDSFYGKVIYASEKNVKEYGWQLGQNIEIVINGKKHKVQLAGIGQNNGALESNQGNISAVMPSSTLRNLYNIQDRYFFALLKTKEGVNVNDAMEKLRDIYPRYKVDEPIPWTQIEGMLNNIIIPFIFMLLLVLATAIFIIYTAFKVITTEKLPVLGTFRSIGATKKTVDFILLGESILYGLIGSALGILLGRLILNGIGSFMASNMGGGASNTISNIGGHYYVFATLFGVFLSVFSSLIPILQISKLSVRDIVLGFTQSFKDNSVRKTILGIVMTVLGMAIPFIGALNTNVLMNLLATVFLCAGLIYLVPVVTQMTIIPLHWVGRLLFGNIGNLSVKNINGNKSILNNISLLTIGIASIILINTLSGTISNEVAKAYKAANFNIMVYTSPMNKNTLQKIDNTVGVTGKLPLYSKRGTKIVGKNNSIMLIESAKDMSYFDYWDHEILTDKDIIKENLGITRSIIISSTLQSQLGVNIGDKLKLELREGREYDYVVVGFMNTMNANGSFAIASESYLKKDANLKQYDSILVKSVEPDETASSLRKTFVRNNYNYIRTTAELEQENVQQNAMVINIFKGFSIVAMFIGTFGILNNFIVSLLSRQRSLAVMKSVGMSKTQTLNMLTIEAVMCGVIGGVSGMIGGGLLTLQVNQFFRIMSIPFSIQYVPIVFISGLLASVVISVLSSLLPARKVAKMNIVSAIKYE